MEERNKGLDAVKGFAIIVVILGHCIGRNNMNDPYLNDAILTIQMPLFFMISGYIMGMQNKSYDNLRKVGKTLWNRFVTYMIPFISWVFVVSIFRFGKQIQNPFEELIRVSFHIDHGLWFLVTIFIINAVFILSSFVTLKLAKKQQIILFTVFVFAFMVLFFIQARKGNNFLGPSFTIKYLPFFYLGYVVAYLYARLSFLRKIAENKKIMMTTWILSILVFITLILLFDVSRVETLLDQLLWMFCAVIGCFACFYGIYRIKKHPRYGLSYIGLYTLELYVLHFRFVELLGFYNKGYKVFSLEGMGAILVTFVTISLISAICIYVIKKVPILDFLLFGKRNA